MARAAKHTRSRRAAQMAPRAAKMGLFRGQWPSAVKWRAAVYAGVVRRVLATAVEIALWWAFTDALPDILFRDARFAAALAFGRGVLSAQAFDWSVMFIAALVHFALSVVYALILSRLIWRLTLYPSLLAGTAFGLVLFSVNMYGFTMVFPWFEACRDWITVVAHLVFGMVAAGVYSVLRSRGLDNRYF